MTTRPLRHADDHEAELANLRDWRDRMEADLVWVDGLIAHIEMRGGDPPAQEQSDSDRRHQVGIGRPPEGWAPGGGE